VIKMNFKDQNGTPLKKGDFVLYDQMVLEVGDLRKDRVILCDKDGSEYTLFFTNLTKRLNED